MSSPKDIAICAQYLTKQQVELVKKEIMDLRGQINHFKALYQSMKDKIAEIKAKNHITTEKDVSKSLENDNITIKNEYMLKEVKSNSVNGNYTNENVINEHNLKHQHDLKPMTQTKEFYDENGIVTVPLLYGYIKRNAKKHERNNNNLKEVELNIATNKNKTIEPQTQASEIYMHKKKRACKKLAEAENMVPIGSGITKVPKMLYEKIRWESYTMATRKLLMAVFTRRVLATHSLTGKPSPAFSDKPAKHCLDPKKVSDIIYEVAQKCKVKENLVRNAITTKCADENKMMKIQEKKRNTTI